MPATIGREKGGGITEKCSGENCAENKGEAFHWLLTSCGGDWEK